MPPPLQNRRFAPLSARALAPVPQTVLDLSSTSSVSSTPQSSITKEGFEEAASPTTFSTPLTCIPMVATPATGRTFDNDGLDLGPVVRPAAAASVAGGHIPNKSGVADRADGKTAVRFPRKSVLKVIDETAKATLQIITVDSDAVRMNKQWLHLAQTPYVIEKIIRDPSKAHKETETAKRNFSHPNLVKYYGVERGNNRAVSVFLEYVNLGSLRTLVNSWSHSAAAPTVRPPSLLERIVLARAVASQTFHGLLYYHVVEEMFHRDIKPDNLLVHDSGRVKLCDFDASKRAEESGVTLDGTQTYMAPEVLTQTADKCSNRMDVWSLGLVLFELIEGRHPLQGVAISSLVNIESMARIVTAEVERMVLIDEVKDLIKRCLTANPCERITCAQALQHPFINTPWPQMLERIATVHGSEKDIDTCSALKDVWRTKSNVPESTGVAKMVSLGIDVDVDHQAPELELSTWKAVRNKPVPEQPNPREWKASVDSVMRRIIHERQRWCEGALAVVLRLLGHRPLTTTQQPTQSAVAAAQCAPIGVARAA